MLCGSICACVCAFVCVCVCGWLLKPIHPAINSCRVSVWGSVNECFAADKQNNCNKKFFFICLLLSPPLLPLHWSVFYATRRHWCCACFGVCVCFRVCCVFYSLALYSKWCPAASCVSCVHQLVWSACLRRFLLLFTGRGIGIEHWNRPDRNRETDICLMLMRIPSVPLSSVHCQHGSFCCAYNERRSEELRMFQSICRCWHPISFTNFTMQQYVGFRQPPNSPKNSLCSVDFTKK